jgi:hypothetical protein
MEAHEEREGKLPPSGWANTANWREEEKRGGKVGDESRKRERMTDA